MGPTGPVAERRPAKHLYRRSAAGVKWNLDPLRVALLLLIVLSISRIHQHLDFLKPLRPALLLVIFALGYAVLRPQLLGREWVRTWPAKVLIGLGIMACLSVPFGISLGGSAQYILTNFSKVLLTAFLLMAVIRGVRDLSMFVWAYVVSCGILAWMSTAVFALSTSSRSAVARLNNLYMYDANDLGLVLLIGFPLAVLTFQTSGRRGKLISAIILLGIGVALARSGSRGALVGLAVVGLALLFTLKHVSVAKRVGFVAVTLLALMAAAPEGYWDQMKTMITPTEDYNWTSPYGRKALVDRGLGYMWRYPIFGMGIGNFGRAEGTVSDRAQNWNPGQRGRIKWSAPHNSFLQVGAELGIPGLILWSSLVFGGIVAMRRMRRRLPRAWARGDPEERFLYACPLYIAVALIGFAATSFFLSFAYLDPIYFLAALMTGHYVSVRAKRGEFPEQREVPSGRGRHVRPQQLPFAGQR